MTEFEGSIICCNTPYYHDSYNICPTCILYESNDIIACAHFWFEIEFGLAA